jgi:LacI family transcriptional regulator, galactose operon repressor
LYTCTNAMIRSNPIIVKEESLNRPNRREVAALAGVSEATVSRVFNNPEQVKDEKVLLVRDAARRLGYRPDKHASALRRRGTGIIIFLEYRGAGEYRWPEIRFFNWLYADILRTVVETLTDTPYHLELRTVSSLTEIPPLKYECDGILAFNVEDTGYAAAVAEAGVPYVCAHHTETLEGFSRCSSDNSAGAHSLGRLLRAAGHSRAAFVGDHLRTVGAHLRRHAGFRHGFGKDIRLVETGVGIEGGMAAARQLVEPVRSGEIRAVCGVNDLTALGLIRGFSAAGIEVPADCVVAGYDNLPVGLGFSYVIPTVDLRLGYLYRKALEGLLHCIRGGEPCSISVEPLLIPGCLSRFSP